MSCICSNSENRVLEVPSIPSHGRRVLSCYPGMYCIRDSSVSHLYDLSQQCKCSPAIHSCHITSPSLSATSHSFAVSFTVPIFSLAPYFLRTFSLWYFQNCLVASLPATRLRIFAPPGCSSAKAGWLLAFGLSKNIRWMAVRKRGRTCHIVHAVVNNDIHSRVGIFVRSYIGCAK